MKVSLDQWRAFVAVVDAGSYAAAAERLHKSQSTVSYAVAQLEALLDVPVFAIRGRRAELTEAGRVLLRGARELIDDAERIERGAASLAEGIEPEVSLAADILFPTWRLLQVIDRFAGQFPRTRVNLIESVLGGTDEALFSGAADLALTTSVPAGFDGEELVRLRLVPVASPGHALHRLGRELSLRDLRAHRQLVVRDTAIERKRESGGWLGADQRLTVSHKATSIAAACAGLGFAWYAEETIRRELEAGQLLPLPMTGARSRHATIHLVFADPQFAGPATQALAQELRLTAGALAGGHRAED